jgi:secreted trypsin-like serine protease
MEESKIPNYIVSVLGPEIRTGDSGAGLIYKDANNGRHYLRGVVSTRDLNTSTSFSTFTDISKHAEWLNNVRNRLEEALISIPRAG